MKIAIARHRRSFKFCSLGAAALLASLTAQTGAAEQTGAAGGATAVAGDAQLQTCTATLGTIRLQDGYTPAANTAAAPAANNDRLSSITGVLASLAALNGGAGAPSAGPAGGSGTMSGASLESLRLLIQQSNCFVIVDRGAVEQAANDEKSRARSNNNEMRDDAHMEQGQEVAADFVLRSSVISLENKENTGIKLGFLSKIGMSGSSKKSDMNAKVQLVLSDVRSKVQLAAALGEGSASNTALAGNILGGASHFLGGVGYSSESKTSSTTVLLQAFADAYNKLVPAVQNYKAQSVKGGLGTGGALRVQGSKNAESQRP
ncbi:hypothetical protein LNV09_04350 [Paucibacter sp. B2R-40]|uniref:CsgG/HfaB family protein n=1 Tax=Paucibacter sp. B2R-40 TaxID=2893554 RepID=UPI0021E4A021|nr:CsgG/HfaB family protein [Paucibacter sp. B2R-40]MCV2353386.1 hypothetical protein [Paucibacter sp. B2R-40]